MDFTGFHFNGYDSAALGILRVSDGDMYNDILGPSFQDITMSISGVDGSYYFNSYDTQREFSLSIAFDSVTEGQLRAMRRAFNGQSNGDLVFDEWPYKVYTAKVASPVQLSYVCFDTPEGNRVYKGTGQIDFVCYYPYAKCMDKHFLSGYFTSAADEEDPYYADDATIHSITGIRDSMNFQFEMAALHTSSGTNPYPRFSQSDYNKLTNETSGLFLPFNSNFASMTGGGGYYYSGGNGTANTNWFNGTTLNVMYLKELYMSFLWNRLGGMDTTTSGLRTYLTKYFDVYYSSNGSSSSWSSYSLINSDTSKPLEFINFSSGYYKFIHKANTVSFKKLYSTITKNISSWMSHFTSQLQWASGSELQSTPRRSYHHVETAGQGNFDKVTPATFYDNYSGSDNTNYTLSYYIYNPGDIDSYCKIYLPFTNNALGLSQIVLRDQPSGEKNIYALKFNGTDIQAKESSGVMDQYICINSYTHLIEGCTRDSSGLYESSGNIYNEYILSGDFFKIPRSRHRAETIEYDDDGNIIWTETTSKIYIQAYDNSSPTAQIGITKIEYPILYY